MSTPSISTWPEVGASSPAISPSRVDLPLPDGPTIARKRPRATWSVSGWRIVSGSVPLITVLETSCNSITCRSALRDGLEHGPHVVGEDPRALRGRVNAVRLVHRAVAGDAQQEKRHERQ